MITKLDTCPHTSLDRTYVFVKRLIDLVAACVGLTLLIPVFAVCAVAIKLNSPGPVFFRQRRVGQGFREFKIVKFRTMIHRDQLGSPLTVGDDDRITTVGQLLRHTKIDELPQLINVLRGEMSLVGPRPEVPCYVEMFHRDYQEILKVRPGVTDFASLKYRDEAGLLALAADPDEVYVKQVMPDKVYLAKRYLEQSSLLIDLGLIGKTLLALCWRRRDS